MKIIFFGTSNVALPILEALSKQHEVLAVVTQPDAKVGRKQELTESPVSVLAGEMKLPVLKPESLKNSQDFLAALQSFAADIFIVVSYGNLIPPEILKLPRLGCVNVHPSLLPKYRGPTPFQTALLNGETKTGTTIMLMDEKLDEGPIIAQEEVLIEADDNAITLGDKLARTSANLLIRVLEETQNGSVPFPLIPQDSAQATYTKILEKADGQIDWNKSADQIYNQFRAYYPWPGVWTKWNGKLLKITDCNLSPAPPLMRGGIKGGVVLEDGIVVCGQTSFIKIKSLQLEGKNEVSIKDFLNGQREFVGSVLA